jgi:DNA polymerase II small subunit/DNA polymerase delta subunit B
MGIKVVFSTLVVSLFLVLAISVDAQTDSVPPPPNAPIIKQPRDLLRDRKEDFREKFQAIRDERKKVMVERIYEKISTMNKTHTARFSTVLEKLMMIIDKISQRTQNAKSKGIDTLAVDSAIAAAKTAIDAAKAAVVVQSAKTYSIEIASKSTLKTNVGSLVSMFRKDLKDVHKAVVDAKQAVQKAERELALARGEKMEKAGENQSISKPPVSEK